jgi:hypothetical protein
MLESTEFEGLWLRPIYEGAGLGGLAILGGLCAGLGGLAPLGGLGAGLGGLVTPGGLVTWEDAPVHVVCLVGLGGRVPVGGDPLATP